MNRLDDTEPATSSAPARSPRSASSSCPARGRPNDTRRRNCRALNRHRPALVPRYGCCLCIQFDVMLPNGDDEHVFLVEKRRDQEALDEHAKGPMPGATYRDWIVGRKVARGAPAD
jgi:hypothetical protein